MGRRSDLDRPLSTDPRPGSPRPGSPRPGQPRPDRAALVRRHDIELNAIDPEAPLQIGNGAFAVAVDVTGLQTFPERYPVAPRGSLLGTNAEWAWHTSPGEHHPLEMAYRDYGTAAGPVPYLDLAADSHDGPDQSRAESWLRANPHRLDLGRVGLWTAAPLDPDGLAGIEQTLELWTGTVRSRFTAAGTQFTVTTAVHPTRDAVGVTITTSPPVPCGVRFRFPYGSEAWGDGAEWGRPEAHHTDVWGERGRWQVRRRVDDHGHWLNLLASSASSAAGGEVELVAGGRHELIVRAVGTVALTAEWTPSRVRSAPPPAAEVQRASADHWTAFWQDGAAVELAGSDDPRAVELERRIVLSQYLTALNSSGSVPPTETGLMVNSWWGRFHLEMHWLHSAHFALWGRPAVVERQLAWYERIRPLARDTARRQRLAGVRWPKQVDPSGRDTPSSIGPFLVWQQPQPIYLAELVRRAARPGHGAAVIERWIDLVADTAEWMAAFATSGPDGFGLGPPIVPAQESYHQTRRTARNPTFELALWTWGLEVAIGWLEAAGRAVPDRWRAVAGGMARPHRHGDGYAALATEPHLVRDDHPSMLAAYGLVPATAIIDPAVMGRTFDDVWSDWNWDSTWGWDYPVAAMCATRLGRPDDAVAALLLDTAKNRHLANGHNHQTAELPIYLPGNGGLLAAVALMAAGWDGAPGPNPGFGTGWRVATEGLRPLP